MKGVHLTNLTLFNTAVPSCSPVRLSQFSVIVGAPKNAICSPAPEIPSEFTAFHRLGCTSVCRLKMQRRSTQLCQLCCEQLLQHFTSFNPFRFIYHTQKKKLLGEISASNSCGNNKNFTPVLFPHVLPVACFAFVQNQVQIIQEAPSSPQGGVRPTAFNNPERKNTVSFKTQQRMFGALTTSFPLKDKKDFSKVKPLY